MRTLKELYTLVLEELDKSSKSIGICICIERLYINNIIEYNEYLLVDTDFQNQIPNIFNKFWWNSAYNKLNNAGYWWTLDEAGLEQRKLFIKDILNKLS